MSGLSRFSAQGKAVLITGCSSGIGRAAALMLAKRGFTVFATVRRESDAKNLRDAGLPNLLPVCPVDLSNLDDVSRLHETISGELSRRDLRGLYALINNAGGGKPAPIELMDLERFRTELHVRILGSVAMVQSFLPLVREGSGRIIWITTPATIPTPYVASIHSCDFAVNCIARTLNIELKRWGIRNTMVRCGGIKTPAGLRTVSDVNEVLTNSFPERVPLYDSALRAWARSMMEFDKKRTDADGVAETIFTALSAASPRARYSVGYMSKAAAILEILPQSLADWILSKRF